MERRKFLIGAAAACLLGSIPFSGCMNYKVIPFEEENGKLKIKKSDFGESSWAVVKSARTNAPVFLSKRDSKIYDAVLLLCTHKQCEVKPSGTLLACPCHGAEFSFDGKVLKDPADKDLLTYETSSDDTNVYIHLK